MFIAYLREREHYIVIFSQTIPNNLILKTREDNLLVLTCY